LVHLTHTFSAESASAQRPPLVYWLLFGWRDHDTWPLPIGSLAAERVRSAGSSASGRGAARGTDHITMSAFSKQGSVLHCEQVSLETLADTYGTPLYVYSRRAIESQFQAYATALDHYPHQVCYAVKANSNLAVLQILSHLGAGFDVVSGGELARVIAAGGNPARVVFSGVGKTAVEIDQALHAGILCFNVESRSELHLIEGRAEALAICAPISIRVNPDVDAKTHPYISTGLKENKFGVSTDAALAMYAYAAASPHLNPVGIDCHIGSQLLDTAPLMAALDRLLQMIDQLTAQGISLSHIDVGGGLGVAYTEADIEPDIAAYIARLTERLVDRDLTLILEPGRSIVANAGVLLTRVLHLKSEGERHFALVDAAMNDLLRPSLYGAWQMIEPVSERSGEVLPWDIVGPVCETGDFLGKQRPLCLAGDDLLAVRGAGAYGFTMASNYNTRPRAAEILVDGDQSYVIRAREDLESLWALETLLPEAAQ